VNTLIANACDCHLHVYEDSYPLAPTATFRPPHSPAADYQKIQREIGLTRAVVIQPTGYGLDNSCTLKGMEQLGPQSRGIVVVPIDIEDDELHRLHAAGVRGVRFMMLPGGVLPWSNLEPMAARIAPLGWHIDLQIDGRDIAIHEPMLMRLPCRLVIDHTGKFLEPVTVDSEPFAALCRVLDNGGTWIKISAPYETSRVGPPSFGDIAPLAHALATRYPERCLWASNWPHPNITPQPSSLAMYEWARGCVNNEATWQKMLVDNPAQLYGFT
jgi:D-galactarolactone isomerase